jgi:hypothetical protein
MIAQKVFFMEKSFQIQRAESRLFHSITIQAHMAAGNFPRPEIGTSLPTPFQGTGAELITLIKETVITTMRNLDYNGLRSFLKILDQLKGGKTLREVKIDSQNEEQGAACTGISHAFLKNIKENHNIDGSLSFVRIRNGHKFVGNEWGIYHAAVIVECNDGFVILDPDELREYQTFHFMPFGKTLTYPGGVSVTAAMPGSFTPIRVNGNDPKWGKFEETYFTHIANGEDLVVKHACMKLLADKIPIVAYDRGDGHKRKAILIYPTQSKIVLKDFEEAQKGNREKEIAFTSIRKEGLLSRLQAFMSPKCPLLPDFNTPAATLHQHILTFVSHEETTKQLMTQTNLDEAFA